MAMKRTFVRADTEAVASSRQVVAYTPHSDARFILSSLLGQNTVDILNVLLLFILLSERQGSATGYRQRRLDFVVEVVILITLSTRSG
jgi:hypothetical protein